MTAILDAILSFWKAAEGFSRTFSMLFCPYFWSYTGHFSLFWAISSIRLMFLLRWQPFWTPSWISWKAPGGFSRTFGMLCYWFFWTYSENLSLSWASSSIQVIFFENDVHFGRHLEFLGQLQGDCPELLVCYSTNVFGPILKILACSELIQAYKWCSLKMTAILDAILDFLESSRRILQDF